MPIYRYMNERSYGPEETRAMVEAYESTLHALRLVDRNDPVTELVAAKILQIWDAGERDPQRIAALAIQELGASRAAE